MYPGVVEEVELSDELRVFLVLHQPTLCTFCFLSGTGLNIIQMAQMINTYFKSNQKPGTVDAKIKALAQESNSEFFVMKADRDGLMMDLDL